MLFNFKPPVPVPLPVRAQFGLSGFGWSDDKVVEFGQGARREVDLVFDLLGALIKTRISNWRENLEERGKDVRCERPEQPSPVNEVRAECFPPARIVALSMSSQPGMRDMMEICTHQGVCGRIVTTP